MTRRSLALFLLALAASAAAVSGCDAGFEGSRDGNAAPETALAVRSTDLREDLDGRRLISTVDVAWSGTDADGVVVAYEVRAYAVGDGLPQPGPEAGWGRTTRRDSTLLLPIPLGFDQADVAVEVRAIDDEGATDETPARTIFPIINSAPSFRLVSAEVPPDSTWPLFSFSFAGADPDGEANLAGIEVALNDTTQGFARLPADATFLTLVAEDPRAMGTTDAQVFLGRGFANSGVTLPGLRLEDENVVYLRAVDQAGATSPLVRFPALDEDGNPVRTLYVRRVSSSVLLVNDFRSTGAPSVMGVAREALAKHGVSSYDEWDLSGTPQSSGNPTLSDNLPVTADPTLRQTLALWGYVYWVSNSVTDSAVGNNLPRVASVLNLFFDQGGRLLVQTPVSLPQSAQGGGDNAAIDILPLSTLIEYPPGIRALWAGTNAPDDPNIVEPAAEVPGTGRELPALRVNRLVTNALPYNVGPDDIPLYRLSFYQNSVPTDRWEGTEVVASIRSDRRVALFSLPLFSGGAPNFVPVDGETEGVADALALLLDGLDFPASAPLARR